MAERFFFRFKPRESFSPKGSSINYLFIGSLLELAFGLVERNAESVVKPGLKMHSILTDYYNLLIETGTGPVIPGSGRVLL